MGFGWPLLWLVDPAGAHLARRSPRLRGPVFDRAAVFGPGVPEGGRQATDEEIAAMDAAFSERVPQEVEAHQEVPPSQVRAAAQRLIREGTVALRADDRHVEARVVRFWRGDSLLEIVTTARGRSSSSSTRIPRRPEVDLLADYLTFELAED